MSVRIIMGVVSTLLTFGFGYALGMIRGLAIGSRDLDRFKRDHVWFKKP